MYSAFRRERPAVRTRWVNGEWGKTMRGWGVDGVRTGIEREREGKEGAYGSAVLTMGYFGSYNGGRGGECVSR